VPPSEEDDKEYRRDPVIELTNEDIQPITALIAQNKLIQSKVGTLRLQYLTAEQAYIDKIDQNKEALDTLLIELRTTYDVDPDIDYELSFPEVEGGLPSFRKL
jgi:hypothetical protein